MLRSCFWAVAISASLMAPYHAQSVHAVASAQGARTTTTSDTGNAGPAVQIAQKDPPSWGGGGFAGGGRSFGGGGGFAAGAVHGVTPGVGSRYVAPGVTGPRFVTPQGRATIKPGIVLGTPRVYARHGVQRLSGANYPRYRHRHREYRYYYRGWWYAFPWWVENCAYWSNVCASQWGYDTSGYYSCMSYYGCY